MQWTKSLLWTASVGCAASALGQSPLKLLPVAGQPGDSYGYAVDVDGEWLVSGAFRDDAAGLDTGAAQVLRKNAGAWEFAAELLPADAVTSGYAGYAVAISGTTIALGAPGQAWKNNALGVVHVYEFDGTAWVQRARLADPTGESDNQFGRSVALAGDRLLVGAPHDDSYATDGGRAWMYRRTSSGWELEAAFGAPDLQAADFFGFSVALERDRAIVGSPYDDDMSTNSGAAWVFERGSSGWLPHAKLLSSDSRAHDAFGTSVAIHRERAIVGAPGRDLGSSDSGAAYVFERGSGAWTASERLSAANGAAGDAFGIAVDTWGLQVIVGAANADRTFANAGAAYRYVRGSGAWLQDGELIASDPRAYSYLGLDVAATWDEAVVGAFLAINSEGKVTGAAYAAPHPIPWWETICTCATGGACGGAQYAAGCTNSTGQGAVLTVFGTPSLSDWQLAFGLSQAPKKTLTYLIAGPVASPLPLNSGLVCVGSAQGTLILLNSIYVGRTSTGGTLAIPPSVTILVSSAVFAGDTFGYQALYRDAKDQCKKWNLSSGVAVTFAP